MIVNTLTITSDTCKNHIDLSKYHIGKILSVNINGLVYKFHYNTMSKLLSLLHMLDKGDLIVITYYPNLSELRSEQLKKLGI